MVDLHLHGQYSLLDGLIKPEPLMEKCKSLGRQAVALTDHGTLGGLVEFHKAAIKAGIKPLLGAEFYHDKGGKNCHLILLARNREGYRNLIRLNNASQGNFYKKPRITDEMIRDHGRGLILLTACVQGWMAQSILAGSPDWEWFRTASSWVDAAYLEAMNHGIPEEGMVAAVLEQSGLPIVGTTDAHYLNAEDKRAHSVGLAVSMRKAEGEFEFRGSGYHVRPDSEVDLPREWLDRTLEVAAAVETYDLGYESWRLPDMELDPEKELADLHFNLSDYIVKRYGFVDEPEWDAMADEYKGRLEYEFAVIRDNGFLPYFKMVADICAFVDGQGKLRGWGRGSASGSLVAFLYGITKIDPIEWGLYFERFLNPDRISPPDIDLDFQPEDRGPVIEYMRQRWGRVYQIGTYTTLGSKEVILSCKKAMGVRTSLEEFVPVQAPVPPISELAKTEGFARQVKAEGNEEFVAVCSTLEGMPKNRSAHASGVVIDADDELPFQISKSGTVANQPITSYDMYSLEDLKTVKIDVLGVNMLSVVDRAARAAGVRVEDIPLDDAKSYELINSGHVLGIFQFETHSFAKIIRDVHPNNFGELVDLNTPGRPGCLESGMTEEYVQRKLGASPRKPIHAKLAGSEEHQGLPLFQEQMMAIARDLAGFTMAEADTLRKAIGKKIKELFESLHAKFVDGCLTHSGVPATEAEEVWAVLEKSARYTWNLSHAVAYTLLSYWTMWLSANYPAEFLCELLNGAEDAGRRRMLLSECGRRGVPISHPLINEAQERATSAGGRIVLGLGGIKFLGETTLRSILKARESGPFSSSSFLKERAKVNKKQIEYLLRAGCFPEEREPSIAEEVEALGYSISGRAIDQGWLRYVADAGEVLDYKAITTKKGDPMAFVTVEFREEVKSVVAFPKAWQAYRDFLSKGAVLGFTLDGDVLLEAWDPMDFSNLAVELPEGKADEFMSFCPSMQGRPNVREGRWDVSSVELTPEMLSFIESEFGIKTIVRA